MSIADFAFFKARRSLIVQLDYDFPLDATRGFYRLWKTGRGIQAHAFYESCGYLNQKLQKNFKKMFDAAGTA